MTFHNETSNGMPTNDDEYISQFLIFESDDKQEKAVASEELAEPLREEEPEDRPDEIYEESSPADDSSSVSPKAKRSPLHNFQKHFVTTIRRSVRLRWPE